MNSSFIFGLLLWQVSSAQLPEIQNLSADAGLASFEQDSGAAVADGGIVTPLSPDVSTDLRPTEPPSAQEAPTAVNPAGPPKLPKSFVGIRGRVTDGKTGEGLIEATIKVVEGAKKSALTDVDGYFKLKLAPGFYDLRVFYELYRGRRIQNVEVKAGAVTELNVELEAESGSVQEVVVEAKADRRKEAALLQERKRSVVVSDSIGAQEIARTPDANAGDAVKRTPSATLVDNKYVFLRGLGGRYALTLLNGTFLPSPEPDEPSVPLDLFPTALVSDLNVLKTYSAEQPAAFGGGLLTINTNTFPSQFELKARLGVSGDTQTTFQRRPGDTNTLAESFGFRDSRRDLPRTFPTEFSLSQPTADRQGVTPEEQQIAAQSLRSAWLPTSAQAAPSANFGLQVGDSIKLGGDRRFGYLAALQFSRREQTKRQEQGNVSIVGGQLVNDSPANNTIGILNGSSSALLNLGFQFSRNHELNLLSVGLLNAETTSTQQYGYDPTSTVNVLNYRQQFTQRQLVFNQLKGFHRFASLRDLEADWQLNLSSVARIEPDIRDTRYFEDSDGRLTLRFQPNSVERFFLNLNETSGGGTLNFKLPFRRFQFQAGGLVQQSGREFDGRRFRFFNVRRVPEEQAGLDPQVLISPERIGPQAEPYLFQLNETTLRNDRYRATQTIAAAYLQTEWKATEAVRLNGGLRFEQTRIAVTGESPFATGGAPTPPVQRTYNDLVPSLNLVVNPKPNVNVRAAYAYTLARPTFRELAPFLFFDIVRRVNVSGQSDLVQTRIHHGDLRVEWFATDEEVFAASLFAKQFENPIERVLVASNSNNAFSFRNSQGATVTGVELEARASLARITPSLRDFKVGANLSLIASQIQLGQASQLGNTDRPLQGQSPYVVNAFVKWARQETGTEAGLFYNVYGPRITEVALATLPDFYEQPFHRLDASVSQKLAGGFELKLTASNILNDSVRIQQGAVKVLVTPPGVQFGASIAWTFSPKRTTK